MIVSRRLRLPALILSGLVGVAACTEVIQRLRPAIPKGGSDFESVVTSSADRGPGSLREAIFEANGAPERARIVIRAGTLSIRTPLPPLANPSGVTLEAIGETAAIDGSAVAVGPVLDVRGAGTIVRNVSITGARAVAISIGASGVLLDSVQVQDSGIGVLQLGGSSLRVERSVFRRNRTGVLLQHEGSVDVRGGSFSEHTEAAIWAIARAVAGDPSPSRLTIRQNQFDRDRIAVVVGNREATVAENVFDGHTEVAVYVAGRSVSVRDNRIMGGERYGILVVGAQGAQITGNETDGNAAVGILVNSSRNTVVRNNRAYRNGYGIVVVFSEGGSPDLLEYNALVSNEWDGLTVVGGSPIVRQNEAVGNREAGLRIMDYEGKTGVVIPADPFVGPQVIRGNGFDEPVRGLYREAGGDRG